MLNLQRLVMEFIVLLALMFIQIAPAFAEERPFRIAITDIPPIDRILSGNELTTMLIFSLIGEPMFTSEKGPGQLDSGVLSISESKALDSSFKSFSLCLNGEQRFSDGSLVSLYDLENSLKRVHSFAPPLFGSIVSTSIKDDCLAVHLQNSHFDYFDALASPFAILIRVNKNASSPIISTGYYHISKFSREQVIFVEGWKKITGDLKQIELVHCQPKSCSNREIDDWNFAYGGLKEIETRISEHNKYPIFSSSVTAFLVNIKNDAERRKFSGCLANFSKELLDNADEKHDGISPQGILIPSFYPGSNGVTEFKLDKKQCSFDKKKAPVTFIDYQPDRLEAYKRLFKNIQKSIPLPIHTQLVNPEDLPVLLTSSKQVFAKLTFLSEGTSGPSFSASLGFFDGLYGKGKAAHYIPDSLEKLISDAVASRTIKERESLLENAHRFILESGLVLPIAVRKRWVLLPKTYENIELPGTYSRIPKYNLITIKKNGRR